jgi:hypothetical protein
MSEEKATYATSAPKTIQAFRNRPCTLVGWDPDYRPPTPEELTSLINLAGWSQTQVAKITGVSYSQKGSTTVRKWRTPRGDSEHREIPYSAWRLLLEYAGVVTVEEGLRALEVGNYMNKCAE